MPKPRALSLRAINRFLRLMYRQELYRQILNSVAAFNPEIVMTYKGSWIQKDFVHCLRAQGCTVVNVYPDCSPHAHGAEHKEAVGAYDLVISSKPFHPEMWQSVYGYNNRCVFVPQGYDPVLHLVPDSAAAQRFDIGLVATWRPEYNNLMKSLRNLLSGERVSVGIGGNGWMAHREEFPPDWVFAGELQGRAYVEWLRSVRVCLAPVTREVVINGTRQPGDEDTTRTYELAAAHCFFIHRRTEYARILYDESAEVPMFDTPEELAEKILYFLPRIDERNRIALAAHRRAVPAYSLDRRAEQVVSAIEVFLGHDSVPSK